MANVTVDSPDTHPEKICTASASSPNMDSIGFSASKLNVVICFRRVCFLFVFGLQDSDTG